MAKKKPFFLTGANAKIKLNGRTIAFATDISYSITVRHASPRVLGRFEVETHQPLTYDVEGTFTIIRYASGAKDELKSNAVNAASGRGNGVGSWGLHTGVGGAIAGAIGLPNFSGQFDGKADEAFTPSRMFQSSVFDIEIIQKLSNESGAGNNFLENLLGIGGGVEGECVVAKLQGCRIEQADFSLSKRAAATQTFRFKAQYAHEDTFIARKSGVGQELS